MSPAVSTTTSSSGGADSMEFSDAIPNNSGKLLTRIFEAEGLDLQGVE
jgi:hypothetical protein